MQSHLSWRKWVKVFSIIRIQFSWLAMCVLATVLWVAIDLGQGLMSIEKGVFVEFWVGWVGRGIAVHNFVKKEARS